LAGGRKPAAVFPRNRASLNYSDREKTPSGAVKHGLNTGEICTSSLLKWFNSLYRPTLRPKGRAATVPRFPDSLLGRRQVVRQWILIPPYGGSNPPAPASFLANKIRRFLNRPDFHSDRRPPPHSDALCLMRSPAIQNKADKSKKADLKFVRLIRPTPQAKDAPDR
jgi:hypothetical protein